MRVVVMVGVVMGGASVKLLCIVDESISEKSRRPGVG